MEKADKPAARRQFLLDSVKMACGVGMLGLGVGLYATHAKALPPAALRPPGAGSESDFLGACIRCGMCVVDCPPKILFLAKPEHGMATGTPYFIARTGPCEMCEHIPCIKACPTNALDRKLTDIAKAKMGIAVLIDQEVCLNFLGLRCDICYRACPVIDKAITLERMHNERTGRHTMFLPVVHSEHCTGCGLCEKACPTEEAAIKVLPAKLAKGKLGSHYRIGWEEKRKAGGSLVAPDAEHQFNLPEGMRYDLGGKGLHIAPPGEAAAPGAPPAGDLSGMPGSQPGGFKALRGNQL